MRAWSTSPRGVLAALPDACDTAPHHQAGYRVAAVATGSDDETVRVWDLAKQRQIGQPLPGHICRILAAAVGKLDGHPIAVTGSDDKTVRVWDLAKQRQIGEPLAGHTGGVCAVALGMLEGHSIAVTGSDD